MRGFGGILNVAPQPLQQLSSWFMFRAGGPVVGEPAHAVIRPSECSAVKSFSGGRGGRDPCGMASCSFNHSPLEGESQTCLAGRQEPSREAKAEAVGERPSCRTRRGTHARLLQRRLNPIAPPFQPPMMDSHCSLSPNASIGDGNDRMLCAGLLRHSCASRNPGIF